MKVLYISGESDFSTLIFKQHGYTTQEKLKELWDKAQSHPNHELFLPIPEEDENICFKALEFGESDPKFIEFLMDKFADYDDLKCHNWYEVY